MPFIAPVIAAVVGGAAAIGSFVGSLGIIGQGIIMAGIGVASTYLISALSPKPKVTDDSVATPGGVNFERQYGTNVSRTVACGLVGIAGHDTYVNTYGPANGYIQQIYTLADYYSTELTRVAIAGAYVELGDDDPDGKGKVVTGDYAGFIWIKFLDGRQTSADPLLVSQANPADRWSTDDVGLGITAVIVTMIYDKDKNNSFPDFFFEFKGAPLYDLRKDSTVGGSGSHRWEDVTTHEYSANPITIEYNYRRGFSVNGDMFCGMGMPSSDLPFQQYTTAQNICDEVQDDGKALYECSINLDCNTTHSDNLQSISLSCGSMQVDDVGGSWPLVGSDQPSVMIFTDQDIISTADFHYSSKQSMGSLVNSVSGNFPSPDQLWSMIGYEPQIASDYVTIDRRTRDISIDFPQVSSARQAAFLAWLYLYENRYEKTATVVLRPRFQVLEAGDWVTWQSDLYGTFVFIVSGKQLLSLDNADGPRNVILTLQERNGQIYEGIAPPPILIPSAPGEPIYLAEVENFEVFAVSIVGDDGRAQPAIRASWLPITDPTVTQIIITYYPVDQAGSSIDKIVQADRFVAVLDGVVGNTLYMVKTKILTNPSRTTVYSAGLTVTTLNIQALNNDDVVRAKVDYILTQWDDRITDIENLIANTTKTVTMRQYTNKDMQQRQMQSVTGTLKASIQEVMTVATDLQSAFAQYQLVVSAEFDAANAAISTLETTYVDLNNAFAEYQVTVTASFAAANANITVNATAISTLSSSFSSYQTSVTASFAATNANVTTNSTAIATVDGKLAASWAVTLNVNNHITGVKQLSNGATGFFIIDTDVFQIANPAVNGGASTTVFALQTVNGNTQMALKGDFYADGVITARMANFTSLSSLSANFGSAVFTGTLSSSSGKMIIDFTNERELFGD